MIKFFSNCFAGHSAGCGINRDVLHWMHNIQSSGEEPKDSVPTQQPNKQPDLRNLLVPPSREKPEEKPIPPPYLYENEEDVVNKYSKEANTPRHNRHKRATGRDFNNKNTCSLYIQTDPLIWRHIREQFPEVK